MSCEEHKVFGPIENLFDFLKNRKYNDYKRVASKRKSSLPADRFLLLKNNSVMKKCVIPSHPPNNPKERKMVL